MKLKKLLLPIAGVASTAAVVAPVVTSCGTGLSFSTKLKEDGTMEKEYESEIDQKSGTIAEADIQKAYFEDIEKNKKIFADDYLCTHAQSSVYPSETYKYSGNYSISVSVSKFDAEKKTLTGKVVYKDNWKRTNSEVEDYEETYKGTTTIICKNLPVILTKEAANTYLFSTDTYAKLKENADWSAQLKTTTENVEKNKDGKDTEKSSGDQTYNKENITETILGYINLTYLGFYSHYLAKIA